MNTGGGAAARSGHLVRRARALAELDRLVDWLETGGVDSAELFGTTDERDWMLRVTAALLALLGEHEVDERGRCRRCREPRRGWRKVLPGSRRAPECAVLRHTAAAFAGDVEGVWAGVLAALGYDMTEEEVRDWLATAGQDEDESAWANLPLYSVDVVNGYGQADGTEFDRELLRPPPPQVEDDPTEPISGWFRMPYVYPDDPTEPGTGLRHYREQLRVWRSPEEQLMDADTEVLPRSAVYWTVADTIPGIRW
ncbi:hypothetical protein BC739_001162 [Kutzneria viridogrisea]|uniref:Uncharacterized protein n=1 Tax=Kutzneria viridogrisea TaxID=47990 RepID=A0ABR6BAR7_9PSEU|nr:hypothetical protein [Kutzneria viridogrisea]